MIEMLILIMIITNTNIYPDHGVGSGVIKAFRQWLSQQLLLYTSDFIPPIWYFLATKFFKKWRDTGPL